MKQKLCPHGFPKLKCYKCKSDKMIRRATTFRVRKCKNCFDRFIPKAFGQHYCLKSDCVKEMLNEIKKRQWKKEKAELTVKAKLPELKKKLQDEINKLARTIDEACGYKECICCGRQMNKQIHGAHFISVGSNDTLRFNLHIIHSATSYCNRYDPEHQKRYPEGLRRRYGDEYLAYLQDLRIQYPRLDLRGEEVLGAIKSAKGLIRMIKSRELKFRDGIEGRRICNKEIGIYL